jgi:hypothetical protein
MNPTAPATTELHTRHRWLRWRWIPIALLLLWGGLLLLMAFMGAICFDGQDEYDLLHGRVSTWRLSFWRLCCTWPSDVLQAVVAFYACWALWRHHWKATRFALMVLVILFVLSWVAGYLAFPAG